MSNDVRVVGFSRNPSVQFYKLYVHGYEVPYIEIFKVPIDDDGKQSYDSIVDGSDADNHGPITVERHAGKFRWELSLDGRMGYDFDSKEDIEAIGDLLAQAMAISAGYTAHGVAYRKNPHGPAIRLATSKRS
jgi:hypothetical protein